MKSDSLIERYIYAVTKDLSPEIRKDVADELNSIISDMLEERCGMNTPDEQAIRAVLKELGTPAELSEKYNPDSKKCLIGSPYYIKYILVLKIVLVSTGIGMAAVGVLRAIFDMEATGYTAAIEWVGTIINGLVSAFAYVTLLFAFFYRKGVAIDIPIDSLDNLPPVPKNTNNISRWESVLGISFSVILVVVFLAAPQIICAVFTVNGDFIPVFNIDAVKDTWYIVIAFAVVGIADKCVKLIEGRYTNRVMAVTIGADIITGVLAFIWLMNDRLINPDFITGVTNLFGKDEVWLINIGSRPQYYFLGIIIITLIIDMGSTVYKTLFNKA